MLNPIKDLKGTLKDLITEQLGGLKSIDLYVVTGVNTDLTVNIKKLNLNQQYDNVELVGQGFGNAKGQIMLPEVDSVVVVLFINDSEKPIVLGSLFDNFSTVPDSRIPIKINEYFVNAQTNGTYLYIKDTNELLIKNPDGEYIRLLPTGLKASNYNSADGTQGATEDVSITEDGGSVTTLHFKNGLYVGKN